MISVKCAYDDDSRLTQLQNVKSATIIAQFDYNMDVVSRRTNRVEQLTSGGAVTDTYKYDGTDQVTNVVYAGATTVTYGYDPLGNLTNKNHGGNSTNYSANNLNQYTNIAGSTLTYDSRGNMLARAGWAYTWDAQNRLLSAESATNKMTFAYDGRNRCINRNAYVWTNSSWTLSTTAYLTYDGWSLIDERNASGTLIARYVNGPTIDELLRRTTGSATNYYQADGLRSTVAITDASGNAQERYRYDIFGMPAIYDGSMNAISASAYGNRTLFQGREWLAEVQLNDHRNRLYAPEIQRWLSRDPLAELAGQNLFAFVRNGSVNRIDPLGLLDDEFEKFLKALAERLGQLWMQQNMQMLLDYRAAHPDAAAFIMLTYFASQLILQGNFKPPDPLTFTLDGGGALQLNGSLTSFELADLTITYRPPNKRCELFLSFNGNSTGFGQSSGLSTDFLRPLPNPTTDGKPNGDLGGGNAIVFGFSFKF